MEPQKTPAPPQEARLHFLDYWRIIRIRKTVILAVFLLVVLTATLVTFVLPESFESSARIKVQRDISDIPELAQQQVMTGYDPYFIQTEFEVIQSEVVLNKVIDGLNLSSKWGDRYNNGTPLTTPETLLLLKNQMNLRPVRNTSLIDISVYSEDKDEAAEIANAIAEAYREYRLEVRREHMGGGISELQNEYENLAKQVQEAQDHVDKLRIELDISDLDAMGVSPSPSMEAETVRRIQGELVPLRARYIQEETQLKQLRALPADQLRDSIAVINPDAELSQLISDWYVAEQNLIALQQDYARGHPTYQNAEILANSIQERIEERISGIMIGLSNRVSSAKAAIDSLESQLQEARAADVQKAAASRPYYRAKMDLQTLIQLRDTVQSRMIAQRVDMELPKTAVVQILNRAEPGLRPVKPNIPMNIALGVIVGLVVGVGLAFFIEYLDTSVKTIDDVERSLQSPVLGVIPQNVGLILNEGPDNPNAEAYRVLRTNLLFSRKDEGLNTACVVSAGAGEGKSTTLLNLATIFAQAGSRVLVVDSDLRRPTLHKMLEVSNTLGLTNYLLKQNALEEVIQTTRLTSLDFLPSGKLPSSSLGILSSSQMKGLIGEVKQRYDFVFFDSPPIMGVSDASILASEVDLALQVIQYRRYPQPMNIRAKQMIEKVGGNLVGIVLNNINMSQEEGYYYSGYYQDYYYKSDEAETITPEESGAEAEDDGTVRIKPKY